MTEDTSVAAPEAVQDAPASVEATDTPNEAPSARDAIQRAFETVDAQQAKPAETPEPEQAHRPDDDPVKPERNPDGTFKAKSDEAKPDDSAAKPDDKGDKSTKEPEKPVNFADAPNRFSADAKAEWAKAPEAVRAEITRAVKEMEAGIEQHRQAFEPYREFDAQLRQNGQDFRQVVAQYTGIENLLRQDPLRGLDTICQNLGTSLREVAAQVTGQPPDQAASANEQTIRQLHQKIAQLEQGVTGLSANMQQDKSATVQKAVLDFAQRPEAPRFDELSPEITKLMQTYLADKVDAALRSGDFNSVLQEAYDLAEWLNPAPQPVPAPQPAPAAQPSDKGRLQPTGAPSSGSNPVNRKPPSSRRGAIQDAFAQVGLS